MSKLFLAKQNTAAITLLTLTPFVLTHINSVFPDVNVCLFIDCLSPSCHDTGESYAYLTFKYLPTLYLTKRGKKKQLQGNNFRHAFLYMQ